MSENLIRRLGSYGGIVGVALIFVGSLITKGGAGTLSYIGVILGALAWLVGLYFAIRMRSLGWIGLLVITAVIAAVVALVGTVVNGAIDVVLVFEPIAFIGFAASASRQSNILDRTVIASFGVISLLTIIISGTFAGGGGIGTTTDPNVYLLNLHMYLIAAYFGGLAWILALIAAFRIQAWGWLATTALLFNIGALMFGLFGPTAEDIRQGRLQKAARRAAGVQ
jgi:hypothetical protein